MMHDSIDADARRLYAMLFAVVLDGEKRLTAHLTDHELTAPQFYVLKTLSEHDGRWGIGQIARAHGLTPATMSGIVNRMGAVSPPLVTREEDAHDRRAVTVVLTEGGAARLQAVQEGLLDQLKMLFALLPADERKTLLEELERYVKMLVGEIG